MEGRTPTVPELEDLLSIDSAAAAEPLFAAARELRRRHFGDIVFLYGFVYFSTYCRNRCTFCLYRTGNEASPRYRKSLPEVVGICRDLAESGVNLLDLTMGEDPLTHDSGDYTPLYEMIAAVRRQTGLPIMISPGVVPAGTLSAMRAAGADFYACYQETHTRELYAKLRVGQDYDERAAARSDARRAGMLVEDGMLTGIGDTVADRARAIDEMRTDGNDQVRIMTFVPQEGTPLADRGMPSCFDELLAIAAMRLAMPDRLSPASLDVEGFAGLRPRLDSGANVVTSIVPPQTGLCGVSNSELDVDEGLRTATAVREALGPLGLRQASDDELRSWMQAARERRTGRVA
ncbi:MAG: methylornithine synthase PylB [Actinobacteria bacterium]|nr:methylornithine synthase PylB [Actinomycetota bacterium]